MKIFIIYKKIVTFGDTETEKHKNLILVYDVGINKIIVSNKVSFSKNIGYQDNKKVRPFCIMLPKMGAYRRDFDKTKAMSF